MSKLLRKVKCSERLPTNGEYYIQTTDGGKCTSNYIGYWVEINEEFTTVEYWYEEIEQPVVKSIDVFPEDERLSALEDWEHNRIPSIITNYNKCHKALQAAEDEIAYLRDSRNTSSTRST